MILNSNKNIKLKFLFIVISLFYFNVSCYSQSFEYKKPKNIYENFIHPNENSVDIKKYLPENYVEDGSIDYTRYIQEALDNNKKVRFPDFPIRINASGLEVRDSSKIFFNRNSKLILEPNDKKKYKILSLDEVTNVNIYNPQLVGERENHKNDEGEWGMGINIENSKNINIYNPHISNTWGDGIYISSSSEAKTDNILIKYGIIDNVRRNGISIISGRNIKIDSVQISNTNGHHPAAGIDLEPNKIKQEIKNITLENIFTFNNQKEGIVFSFSNLLSPKSSQEISVKIRNHHDIGARYAIRFFKKGFKNEDRPLSGNITIKNSLWEEPRRKAVAYIPSNNDKLPKILLEQIKVKGGKYSDGFEERFKKKIKKLKSFRFIP